MWRFKILFIATLTIGTGSLQAQRNTLSPYSRYGIGDISQGGYGPSKAMGGTGIATRLTNQINFLNPASYTSQDSMSFIFDVGANSALYNFKSSQGNSNVKSTSIDHFAIGFPIGKWMASSIGIAPFSAAGYNMVESGRKTIISNGYREMILFDNHYSGQGGLNRFYVGAAFDLGKYISIGTNMNYLFGSLDQTITTDFLNESKSTRSLYDFSTVVGDVLFNFGLQTKIPLNAKNSFIVGITYANKTAISAYQTSYVRSSYSSKNVNFGDTAYFSKSNKSSIILPQSIGLGLSYNHNDRVFVTADYRNETWSKSTFLGKIDSLVDSRSFHAGLQITPDPTSITSYLNRVMYRAGFHYTETYLKIHGQQLHDYGISFGAGLPLPNSKSVFNIAFELGRRGTIDYNLVQENYGMVTLNLSFYDFWFFKRRYD